MIEKCEAEIRHTLTEEDADLTGRNRSVAANLDSTQGCRTKL